MNASDAGSVGGGPSMRALVDQIEEMQRNYTSASLALKTEKQRVTARRVEYRAVCDEVQRAYQTVTQLIRAKAKAESELDDLRASGAAGPHDRDTTKAIREHNTRLRHQISAMEKELDAKWYCRCGVSARSERRLT